MALIETFPLKSPSHLPTPSLEELVNNTEKEIGQLVLSVLKDPDKCSLSIPQKLSFQGIYPIEGKIQVQRTDIPFPKVGCPTNENMKVY